ncbi:MAG: HDOD domain-containing protein [Cellvibrionaceae bacterium]
MNYTPTLIHSGIDAPKYSLNTDFLKKMENSSDIYFQSIADISNEISANIKDGAIDVPILPSIASKVIMLTNQPDSNAAELAKLIQSDPPLAAHVMRIANSAVYSPNSSLVSLQQAIARLGMSLITEIAVSASLNSKMFYTPGLEKHTATIWEHGLLTALWAKEISRTTRKNVEATFLCGLLHSIGHPVALHMSFEISSQKNILMPEESHLKIAQKFEKPLGISTLQQWSMPEIIVSSIEYFEDYKRAPQFKEQTATVYAASLLATESQQNAGVASTDTIDKICDDDVWSELNIYRDEVEKIISLKADTLATLHAMES